MKINKVTQIYRAVGLMCVSGKSVETIITHRRVVLEGAHKAMQSNPLLSAGIYPKASLTDGCPAASCRPPVWEKSPRPPWATGSAVVLL